MMTPAEVTAERNYRALVEEATQQANVHAMGRPMIDEELAASRLMAHVAKAGMPGGKELRAMIVHFSARAIINAACE